MTTAAIRRPFHLIQYRALSQKVRKNVVVAQVDKDCLPVAPTWTVQSLLQPASSDSPPSITDKQFNHLFRLAQLRPPTSQRAKDNLKRDLDQLSQFTEHIQELGQADVEPLIQLWEQGTGLVTRPDVPSQSNEEPSGRVLMDNAEQKHGNFYVVKSKIAIEE